MSSKKSIGSRKDPSKTPKVWERARREKMKIYFNELQEVLPFYDPSAPMSRFEILQKSKVYIKDLQDQNQDLLNGGFDEVYKIKMTKLKQRVKELLKRVDQLTDLLRTANIMIPPLESYPDGSKNGSTFKWMSQHPKKWTEKINLVVPDDKIKSVLTLIKDYKKNSNKLKLKKKQTSKSAEKSDIIGDINVQKPVIKKKKVLRKGIKVINLKSAKTGKSDQFPESESPSQFKENQPVDFNLLSNNATVTKTNIPEQNNSESVETSKSISKNPTCQAIKPQSSTINKVTTIPQNVILPSVSNVLQPNTFILTNDGSLVQLPILNSSGAVLNPNSNLLTPAAVVKPNGELITPLVINKPSPVIVLQKPSPQIFQAAQIISATPQVIASQPSVQILGTTNVYTVASTITTAKTLPHILSKTPANKKRITRDSTVTTYVNKIPIPAPSKQSYLKKSEPVNPTKKETGSARTKTLVEKPLESANEKITENQSEKESSGESSQTQNEKTNSEVAEKGKEKSVESSSESSEKRSMTEEKSETHKKQKLNENLLSTAEDNVFKPIENDTAEVFCNLGLPNSMNPSLSVSPTAAFLSSFPIVAPTRSEAEEEAAEKKSDEGKDAKPNEEQPVVNKNKESSDASKGETDVDLSKDLMKDSTSNAQIQVQITKEKITVTSGEQIKFFPNRNFTTSSSINTIPNKNSMEQQQQQQQQQLAQCKSWEQFHQETSDTFYMPSESGAQINNSGASIGTVNPPILSYSVSNENSSYKNYSQNPNVKTNMSLQNNLSEQVTLENNHFEYLPKENYMSKVTAYNNERTLPAKPCTNNGNMNESYGLGKSQSSNYQIDSGPSYQLIPAKEVPNQRNSRTVNWMTEPDVSNRPPVYGLQSDKMVPGKLPAFTQSDNFYMNNQSAKIINDCSGNFIISDQNKTNYQKNDFYGKDQRCKNMEKRAENKCYAKTSQNSYNIFDYNYSPSCYGDESANKYCQNQSYSGKIKKNVTQQKKKSDVHQVNNELTPEPVKRTPDQTVATNVDFNSVANQECFTWVPGKNVEWLPSKSFGLDTNLVVPSTLPTLVGDLALGTTSANDINQKNVSSKSYQSNLKANVNDVNKDYVDISMGSSALPKPMEAVDANKQYFEPFANLSKNIFDVTNTSMNNSQMPKNDYEKINFVSNNSNETIVLKNIFELPVSKSSVSDFSRNKQRTVNNSQNTFLSVSQLVEPSGFEGNSMKNDTQESATKVDPYTQNYPNYNNQKAYKNKARSSHCKFNDRKYHGYKNGGSSSSSSYTAEALIRSNSNVNYQPNEFSASDVSINFFNAKPGQKPEQFAGNNKIDFEINMKSDFSSSTGQNIYSDFNFSSPVPNFTIGPTVGTDFGNHDSGGNFSTQNNSFFGDFVTPEYPLSENVSNSLLLPQCSIALQNPFVIDKRTTAPAEKNKNNSKQFSTSRNRKHYDCTKTSFNEFSITPTSAIFTTSSIACPPIFTTSACQNLLPVPTQSIPITFSSPSFSTSNIPFPSLSSATNNNYHRFPNSSQNPTSGSFLSSNTMFTTCTSKPLSSSHTCYSSNPLTSVTNSVISSFPVGNVPLSSSSQSGIPFFSLSNPIIPSSVPTSSSNSLANFNLSTIFPEINQKGNYHYS